MNKKTTMIGLLLIAAMLWVFGCSGGSSTPEPNNQEGTTPPSVQGNIAPQPAPGDYPPVAPPSSGDSMAPLGTNPVYEVQEAANIVETFSLGGATSSVKSSSQIELPFEVLWVAVAPRDTPFEDVVAGQANPDAFDEGAEVDLYIAYTINDDLTSFYREWAIENAGLYYIEPNPDTRSQGDYASKLPFTIPYGTSNLFTTFIGALSLAGESVLPIDRGTSAVVPSGFSHYRWVDFEIADVALLPLVNYPDYTDGTGDDETDSIPDWIIVDWIDDSTVHVECEKELSSIVLAFADDVHEKWDDLDVDPTRVYTGDFWGTVDNEGKAIVTVWVKSGTNDSGDGPGYGERFDLGGVTERLSFAQIACEDLLAGSDYDYNDFVCNLRATEVRNLSDELVQVSMTVKAVARAAGYNSDWQFNIDASFPEQASTDVIAIVNQFYADGTRHGHQRLYISAGGMSVPIFTPIREALPSPPGSYATNGVPGTEYIDGDYAEVTIILNKPLAQGMYTPMPYQPELRVQPYDGDVYTIKLWTKIGDWLDSNGWPLAFIVPDTYAWPLEGVYIADAYPDTFNGWIHWVNTPADPKPDPMWYDVEPVAELVFSRDKFLPWPIP